MLDGTGLSGEEAYRVLLGFRDRMGAWRVYCQVAHKSPQAPENAVEFMSGLLRWWPP